jgi:hypothetical protein
MTESILNTIKQMLGINASTVAFDNDILVNINSAFMVLHQLGVGPQALPFSIVDDAALWSEFSEDILLYQAVKTYIYLKVKITFDPPGTSFHGEAYKQQIQELEWRLCEQVPVPPDEII